MNVTVGFQSIVFRAISCLLFLVLFGCVVGGESKFDDVTDPNETITVVSEYELTPSVSTYNFGTGLYGVISNQTITVTNTGLSTATGCSLAALSGSDAAEFSIVSDGCGTTNLASGATCNIQIGSTPADTGANSANLNWSCLSASIDVTLSATGDNFQISSSGPTSGATGIDPNSNIDVVFKYNADSTTLIRDNVKLRMQPQGFIIDGSYSYNSGTKTLSFDPYISLDPSQAYRMDFSASTNASSGAATLTRRTSISFTTSDVAVSAHGYATTSATPVINGKCSTNVTTLTATLNGSPQAFVDSDCSDGLWEMQPTLASTATYQIIITAGDGSTSSVKTFDMIKCGSLAAIVPDTGYTGAGTSAVDPYLIDTKEKLAGIASDLTSYYKLTANIDLSCSQWTPLGSAASKFTGEFNGDGKTISYLTIEAAGVDYQGLFGYGYGGDISSLGVIDAYVDGTGRNKVGILMGMAENQNDIDDVFVTGHVLGYQEVGGISGYMYDQSDLRQSYGEVDVDGSYYYVGGLVGRTADDTYYYNEIFRNYFNGTIHGAGYYFGGIVGYTKYTNINDSYSTGTIVKEATTSNNGGLVGWLRNSEMKGSAFKGHIQTTGNKNGGLVAYQDASTIYESTSSGTLSATSNGANSGGITGLLNASGDIIDSHSDMVISVVGNNVGGIVGNWSPAVGGVSRSYFAGSVAGGVNVNEIVGSNTGGSTSHGATVFFLDTGCGVSVGGGGCPAANTIGIGLSSSDMESQSTFSGWTFGNGTSWILETGAMPKPHLSTKCMYPVKIAGATDWSGAGTLGSPYQVTDVDQLQGMKSNVSANYILSNDIDFTNECVDWSPVGVNGGSFTGTLDGNSKTITGGVLKDKADYLGFFGSLNGATITDLTLESRIRVDLAANGGPTVEFVGVLVGKGTGVTLTNITVNGDVEKYLGNNSGGVAGYILSSSTLTNITHVGKVVTRGGIAGGVIGYLLSNSTLTGSTQTGDQVSGNSIVGGLVGATSPGVVITNTSSNSTIWYRNSMYSSYGGLVGYLNGGTITNSSAMGTVRGSNMNIGGLVGYANNSVISNSFATGSVDTHPSGANEYKVGGLIGHVQGTISLTNCYATGNVDGVDRMGGLIGYILSGTTGTIDNNYATGTVTASANSYKLIGLDSSGALTITDNYVLDNTCNAGAGGGCAETNGGTQLIDAEMKAEASYNTWDFGSNWSIVEGVSYPTLQ
ncbi:MAG: hypothetical protein HOE90_20840 [Bacteriovoracaceae bacterium]|jgi:hypothetical protein|nr:hypothetical protein [Bacteriovoracaceae bacterium]